MGVKPSRGQLASPNTLKSLASIVWAGTRLTVVTMTRQKAEPPRTLLARWTLRTAQQDRERVVWFGGLLTDFARDKKDAQRWGWVSSVTTQPKGEGDGSQRGPRGGEWWAPSQDSPLTGLGLCIVCFWGAVLFKLQLIDSYMSRSLSPPPQPLPSPPPSGNMGVGEQALVLTFLSMASAAEQGKK